MREVMTLSSSEPAFESKRRRLVDADSSASMKPTTAQATSATFNAAATSTPLFSGLNHGSFRALQQPVLSESFNFSQWRYNQPSSTKPTPKARKLGHQFSIERDSDAENQGDDLNDSLTNLQWLKNFSCASVFPVMRLPSKISTPSELNVTAPTHDSDHGQDHHEDADEHEDDDTEEEHAAANVDWKTNGSVKPPYSYASLIYMAMKALNKDKYTLSDIYSHITDNFLYYRLCDPGWKNSIRHNLSQNGCFEKIARRESDPGKGGYWKLKATHECMFVNGIFKKPRKDKNDQRAVVAASIASDASNSKTVINKRPAKPTDTTYKAAHRKPSQSHGASLKHEYNTRRTRQAPFSEQDEDESMFGDVDIDVADSSSLSEMDWGCFLGPSSSAPAIKLETGQDVDIDDIFGCQPFGGSHLRVSDSKHSLGAADGPFDLSLNTAHLDDKFSWMFTPPGAQSLSNSFRGLLKPTDSFGNLGLGLRTTPPPLSSSLTEALMEACQTQSRRRFSQGSDLQQDSFHPDGPVPRDWLAACSQH